MRCVIVIGHMKIVSTKIGTSIPLRKLLLNETRLLSAEIDTTKIETTNSNETIIYGNSRSFQRTYFAQEFLLTIVFPENTPPKSNVLD